MRIKKILVWERTQVHFHGRDALALAGACACMRAHVCFLMWGGRGRSVYSPMTSAALVKAMKVGPGTLRVSKVNGGKYPIIHVWIKTQRSGLMKAFGGLVGGGAVILSNREGSPANTALIKPLC